MSLFKDVDGTFARGVFSVKVWRWRSCSTNTWRWNQSTTSSVTTVSVARHSLRNSLLARHVNCTSSSSSSSCCCCSCSCCCSSCQRSASFVKKLTLGKAC